MLRLSPLAPRMVPSACAQLPEIDPVKGESAARLTVSDRLLPLLHDTKPTQLLMCDVEYLRVNRVIGSAWESTQRESGASPYPSKFLYRW